MKKTIDLNHVNYAGEEISISSANELRGIFRFKPYCGKSYLKRHSILSLSNEKYRLEKGLNIYEYI